MWLTWRIAARSAWQRTSFAVSLWSSMLTPRNVSCPRIKSERPRATCYEEHSVRHGLTVTGIVHWVRAHVMYYTLGKSWTGINNCAFGQNFRIEMYRQIFFKNCICTCISISNEEFYILYFSMLQ